MPDNPRKKKHDRKRQSQQKHEVAYRNRARGGRSQSRKTSRSQRKRTVSNRSGGGRSRASRGTTSRGQSGSSQTMRELLTEEMADIYNAEKQLVRALPKMARGATSDQLRMAFEQHLDETREQVRRIEQAFEALGQRPKSKKCDGMEGLIKEGEHMLEEDLDGAVLDAGLIAAAQKVEHYEIASYGTICTWAELLGETPALRFLKQNMSEEEATDRKLTELAKQINQEAQNQGGGDQEEEGTSRGRGKTGIRDFVSRVFPS
jgi:ferritin-like metal-binding protein YciE